MTAMKGWLALNESLRCTNSRAPRPILCARIAKAVEEKTGVGTAFDQNFQALKQNYLHELRRRRHSLWLDTTFDRQQHITEVRRVYSSVVAILRQASPREKHHHQKPSEAERLTRNALKIKWVIYSGPPGVAMSSAAAVWAQAKRELDTLIACGVSWTSPGSNERRNEVYQKFEEHNASFKHPEAVSCRLDQFLAFGLSSRLVQKGS